jgi:hypothetical protein
MSEMHGKGMDPPFHLDENIIHPKHQNSLRTLIPSTPTVMDIFFYLPCLYMNRQGSKVKEIKKVG